MPDDHQNIPQPVPIDSLPPTDIPISLKPMPPGSLRITIIVETDTPQLAIIFKRSYGFDHNRPCWPLEEQIPLDEEGCNYSEIAPNVTPSVKSLPEVIGLKTGTDVVIQGSACPPTPMSKMTVEAAVGPHSHTADVIGDRYCDYHNGRVVFSPPKKFEEIPLRYEYAYGGRDLLFEAKLLEEARHFMTPDQIRRATPSAEALFKANNPLMYPRNRFGKGYVIEERREFIIGRELPNIERSDDRLTPERLVVGNPLSWPKQPIPVGFDYLDPLSFPRSAMLGMPPAANVDLCKVEEVNKDLVPKDFFRGNLFAVSPEKASDLLHPGASRCASLGLWMPFLRGDEDIVLTGMDSAIPKLHFRLPAEVPVFTLNAGNIHYDDVPGRMQLVLIDIRARILSQIWAAKVKLPQTFLPGMEKELMSIVKTKIRKVGL